MSKLSTSPRTSVSTPLMSYFSFDLLSELQCLFPAACAGLVHYLYHNNKLDALSVLICGYIGGGCKNGAIDMNEEFGFIRPSNPALQVIIASLSYSTSLGILLHALDTRNEAISPYKGPIIGSCYIGAAFLKYFSNACINGYNVDNPQKAQIDMYSGVILSAAFGASIGTFIAYM
eukprot:3257_1